MRLDGRRRTGKEADLGLDAVPLHERRLDKTFQRSERGQKMKSDCRSIGVHGKADGAGTGADTGDFRMRVGGFHPGQQQDEKHACKSRPAQQAAGFAAVSCLKVHVRLQDENIPPRRKSEQEGSTKLGRLPRDSTPEAGLARQGVRVFAGQYFRLRLEQQSSFSDSGLFPLHGRIAGRKTLCQVQLN